MSLLTHIPLMYLAAVAATSVLKSLPVHASSFTTPSDPLQQQGSRKGHTFGNVARVDSGRPTCPAPPPEMNNAWRYGNFPFPRDDMLLSKIILVKAPYAYRCIPEGRRSPHWQGGVVRPVRSNSPLERYMADEGKAYDYSGFLVARNLFTPRTLYAAGRPNTGGIEQVGGYFEFRQGALAAITFRDSAAAAKTSPGKRVFKSLWLVPFGWHAAPRVQQDMEWAFFVGGSYVAADGIVVRAWDEWDEREALRVMNEAPVFVYRMRTRGGAPPPWLPQSFAPSEADARQRYCASKTTRKGDEQIVTAEYWVFEAQQQAKGGYWLKERLCTPAKSRMA